jgi:O-antigen/teichoic acid export membrane protein
MTLNELESTAEEVLLLDTAGSRAVRGGIIRVGGYVVSAGLIALTSIFLLRYLGVRDFGRYVTVMSLVAIAGGVSDVGLTFVGQREYVVSRSQEAERRLVSDILGIRLLLTPITVVAGAGFGVIVGYGRTLVLGTLLAGLGLVLSNASKTLAIPLASRLRLGALTSIETAYPVLVALAIAALVAAGAGFLPFFAIHVAAGAGALMLALAIVDRSALAFPRVSWRQWRPLIVEAAPLGMAILIGVIYLRLLVVLASLFTSSFETGLFSTSYRILEIVIGVPAMMVGAAFPILAQAGSNDEKRLGYALQLLLEASVLAAGVLVLALGLGGDAIVRLLGGEDYAAAGPVLEIQSFALLGSFMTAVWTAGLVAIRRQSAVIATNAIALVTVVALGSSLIPLFDAKGAAVAAVAGEAVLAAATLIMLIRARPQLVPDFRFIPKVLAAGAAGGLCIFIPGLPSLATAAVACLVYATIAYTFRAIPVEINEALLGWIRGARAATGGESR